MKFHAYHGCLDFEKQLGNTFFVTVTMELDTTLAGKTDNLENTLNYQEVYDVVAREMKQPSDLIEHVIQRIYDSLKKEFSQIQSLKVKLSKQNPPLGGEVESVSIEI